MRKILSLVAAGLVLAGCSSPANREVRACEEFFSIPASVVAGSDNHIASVVGLGNKFSGTSIGRALGEYGRSLQMWLDDFEDWTSTSPGYFLDDRDRRSRNNLLAATASDQGKELITRCDDLLTRG